MSDVTLSGTISKRKPRLSQATLDLLHAGVFGHGVDDQGCFWCGCGSKDHLWNVGRVPGSKRAQVQRLFCRRCADTKGTSQVVCYLNQGSAQRS